MKKPAFCLCENKGADQLGSNCAADQGFCFHYIDITIPLLPKSKISSLCGCTAWFVLDLMESVGPDVKVTEHLAGLN